MSLGIESSFKLCCLESCIHFDLLLALLFVFRSLTSEEQTNEVFSCLLTYQSLSCRSHACCRRDLMKSQSVRRSSLMTIATVNATRSIAKNIVTPYVGEIALVYTISTALTTSTLCIRLADLTVEGAPQVHWDQPQNVPIL